MQSLSVSELAAWLADSTRPAPLLVDVREPWEYEICHIKMAVLIPMQTIPARLNELALNQPIVCICHHGMRSMQVATFLERKGFSQTINLTGGMHAWAQQIDGDMPTY